LIECWSGLDLIVKCDDGVLTGTYNYESHNRGPSTYYWRKAPSMLEYNAELKKWIFHRNIPGNIIYHMPMKTFLDKKTLKWDEFTRDSSGGPQTTCPCTPTGKSINLAIYSGQPTEQLSHAVQFQNIKTWSITPIKFSGKNVVRGIGGNYYRCDFAELNNDDKVYKKSNTYWRHPTQTHIILEMDAFGFKLYVSQYAQPFVLDFGKIKIESPSEIDTTDLWTRYRLTNQKRANDKVIKLRLRSGESNPAATKEPVPNETKSKNQKRRARKKQAQRIKQLEEQQAQRIKQLEEQQTIMMVHQHMTQNHQEAKMKIDELVE